MQKFIDLQKKIAEEQNEKFDPLKAITMFHEDLHSCPEGKLSVADEVKINFAHQPGHEAFLEILE